MRCTTIRGVAVVPLSVKVPASLRTQARAEAIAAGVTFEAWITGALVEALARRRALGA